MANLKEVTWNTNIQTKEIQLSDGSCSYLFWLVVLILTSLMFVFETCRSVSLYMDNPLASNLEQVFFENITLPAVAACVTEAISVRAQDDFGETGVMYLATAVAFVPPFLDPYKALINEMDVRRIGEEFKATKVALGITDLNHYMLQEASASIDEAIAYCAMGGDKFSCLEMFTEKKYWDANFCCMADTKRNVQTVPGSRGGLTFHLKTDQVVAKYQPGWSIWLYSHADGEELDGPNYPQPVTIGLMVDLRVRKWRSIRINRRGSECRQNAADPSLAVCQRRCEANASNETHGCVRIGQWNEDKKYRYCEPGLEGYQSYHASGKVKCKCTVGACESVEYKSEILVRKMTDNENTTIVRIYYDTLSEMVLEQKQTVSVAQLVGSFGGQASLWLGIKFATVARFLFYANRAVLRNLRGTRGAVEDSKA